MYEETLFFIKLVVPKGLRMYVIEAAYQFPLGPLPLLFYLSTLLLMFLFTLRQRLK